MESTDPAAVLPVATLDLVEQFQRDGFVVVPGLISDEELDGFAPVVTNAVKVRTANDNRSLTDRSTYEQSFVQCMNLWEDNPEVRGLTFHPRIAQAAAELLQASAVRLWHDQALYKLSGGRGTDAHQDHPYWPMLETETITAWVPFEGSTRASGAMAFLPGSHRIGLRKFVNIFFGEPDDFLRDPEISGIAPQHVEVPKGSVSFHHGLTVHLADANTTDRDRPVHTMIYFPDGNTRGYPFPHFAVDRAGIELGQAIASDVTPIAWPRPDASLPLPPAPIGELPNEITMRGTFPQTGTR